jgi:hypothetical protein
MWVSSLLSSRILRVWSARIRDTNRQDHLLANLRRTRNTVQSNRAAHPVAIYCRYIHVRGSSDDQALQAIAAAYLEWNDSVRRYSEQSVKLPLRLEHPKAVSNTTHVNQSILKWND